MVTTVLTAMFFYFVFRGISHSALSDMKTIEQEKPAGERASSSRSSILQRDSDGFFDEFQFSSSGLSIPDKWERQSNLSRFEGSSSISSAEYFGESRNVGGSGGFSSQFPSPPDLEDVKESVRQGVTKVAGKLSSLANGVMSSIQPNMFIIETLKCDYLYIFLIESTTSFFKYKSSPGEGLTFESMLLDSSTRFPPKSWETEQPRSTTSPRNEERPKPQREIASGNEAQKKFGSAKAISSDQFFRDSSETNDRYGY
ncbi:hypothetical protein J437_LFUL004186 [Ladona fulva]|uniref:Uncharacterized protein n=1 Tax=Ladona fulva TaxID=123851 RepID=A0A8K0K1G5_LADFU|nr:hypothetical protein J437_LFUL004186 [Ladona fulva]